LLGKNTNNKTFKNPKEYIFLKKDENVGN